MVGSEFDVAGGAYLTVGSLTVGSLGIFDVDAEARAGVVGEAPDVGTIDDAPEAFGEIYRRHESAVIAFFVHWTISPELATDLTAETFAAAFSSLSGYASARGEPRQWLFGIARHVLARSLERGRVENQARTRLGMPRLMVDDAAIERIEDIASLDGSALTQLGELSVPISAAVSGRVVQERDYRELAQSLACSESVVRQRVRRGLAQLRDRLETKR